MKRGITPQKAEEIRLARGLGRGSKLRQLRLSKGMSQSELSAASEVPLRTLQKYEQFENNVDSAKLNTLCQICLILECKISDIIENEELIERFNEVK